MKTAQHRTSLYTTLTLLMAAPAAMAHHLPPVMEELDEFLEEPLAAALKHPFTGIDHLLAAFAVGLLTYVWGRKLGMLSMSAFLGSLAVGVQLGHLGVALPLQEQGLAASVMLAGALLAGPRWFSQQTLLVLSCAVGLRHGVAHGCELPPGANFVLCSVGLVLGSGLITVSVLCLSLLAPKAHPLPARMAASCVMLLGAGMLIAS